MRKFALLLGIALAARAETYTLTLKQAVDRALSQNPEVVMARMDELKATLGISYAKSPFTPRVDVGTGAAYTQRVPSEHRRVGAGGFPGEGDRIPFQPAAELCHKTGEGVRARIGICRRREER